MYVGLDLCVYMLFTPNVNNETTIVHGGRRDTDIYTEDWSGREGGREAAGCTRSTSRSFLSVTVAAFAYITFRLSVTSSSLSSSLSEVGRSRGRAGGP